MAKRKGLCWHAHKIPVNFLTLAGLARVLSKAYSRLPLFRDIGIFKPARL